MSTNSTSPPPDNSSSAAAPPTNSTPSPPPPSESTPSPPPPSSESPPTSDNGSSVSNNLSSSLPSNSQPSTPTPVPPKSSSSTPSSKSLTRNSPDKDSSFSSDGSGLNLPIIVGTVAGVAFFIVLMMIVCMCCFQKKKKKKPRNQMHYYSDYQDSDLYSTGLPPKWHNGHQGMDHVVKVQPQGGKHGGGWHMPQQQTMMSSGEMSSGYSGPHGAPLPPPSPALALGFNKSTFSYEELAAATSGFSQANLLGQGGFGYVHKGVLPNGKVVAVKQLKAGSGQGEREFHAEVDIISRVHHRHLVSLVGYCIAGSQRLLVYDFVENRTLEYHLHGKGLPVMDFHTRLKIAIGAAKGLAYLHEDCHPRIIHRDIKSANILLDFKFEAMVADFGLAKLTTDNHTHVSTRVMGTFGYLAPEYASSGKLTEKSDVFSYGVMLLEIITGRRPVDNSSTFMEDSLVDWARPVLMRALGDGNFDEVVDPRLDGNYDPMEIARMAACAAAAVRHSAKRRPKMSQIVRALEGDVSLEDLNEGMRPGQSMLFSSGSDYDSGSYMTSMNRIRKAALASPEYSDDYSGPVADYGHHSGSSSDMGYTEDMNAVGHHGNRRYGL